MDAVGYALASQLKANTSPTESWWNNGIASLPATGSASAGITSTGTLVANVAGYNGANLVTTNAYDVVGNAWTAKTALPSGGGQQVMGASISNIGYVVGGAVSGTPNNAYDFTGNTWTAKAACPNYRRAGAGAIAGGHAYFFAGVNGSGSYQNLVDMFDPVGNTWTAKASVATVVAWLVASGLSSATIIIADGSFTGTTNGATYTYDTAGNTYTTKTSDPTGRYELAGGVLDDSMMHTVGGLDGSNTRYATVNKFDPTGNTWTTEGGLPGIWDNGGWVTGPDGRLYLMGGEQSASGSSYTAYTTIAEARVPALNFSTLLGWLATRSGD